MFSTMYIFGIERVTFDSGDDEETEGQILYQTSLVIVPLRTS